MVADVNEARRQMWAQRWKKHTELEKIFHQKYKEMEEAYEALPKEITEKFEERTGTIDICIECLPKMIPNGIWERLNRSSSNRRTA